MFVNSDFSDLLRLFNDNGVRYLVVGGYAVVQYAEPRYTKDLDLWISTDPHNAAAVFGALRAFGAPLKGMTVGDFGEEGFFYQMGAPPVRVDIMMGLPGVTFDEAWTNRNVVAFDDLAVPFISREDLVLSKRATGRPQDLIDLEHLSGTAP